MSLRLRASVIATLLLLILDVAALESFLRFLDSRSGVLEPIVRGELRGNPAECVLFLGDSTIVGTNVRDDLTLPNRFADLAFRAGIAPITVWSYARPGSPISLAAQDGIEAIAAVNPTLIIVRAGVVDRIVHDPVPQDAIRKYRILELIHRVLDIPIPKIKGRYPVGPRAAELRSMGVSLAKNNEWVPAAYEFESSDVCTNSEQVERIVARTTPLVRAAQQKSIPIIMINYFDPRQGDGEIGANVREAARQLKIPIVETHKSHSLLAAAHPDLSFTFTDGHPTALGYGIEVHELFIFASKVKNWAIPPLGGPEDWLQSEWKRRRESRRYVDSPERARIKVKIIEKSAEFVSIQIKGRADTPGWLLIGEPAEPFIFSKWEIPLNLNHTVAAGAYPWSKFIFDSGGNAIVKIPSRILINFSSGVSLVAVLQISRKENSIAEASELLNIASGAATALREIDLEDTTPMEVSEWQRLLSAGK
ncbi:MAG: hypothetical protein ACKVS6_14300 [Planctomycetota bacterium]